MLDDVTGRIFAGAMTKAVRAELRCCSTAVLAGMDDFRRMASEIGLKVVFAAKDGSQVEKNEVIAVVEGNPPAIAAAEDSLLGLLAKPSGVATAARKAIDSVGGELEIVCGAWKKTPPTVRETLKKAASLGGVKVRISDKPFIYLDKNYVKILGGVKKALSAASAFADRIKVVQVGKSGELARETAEALENKADIIFVDTGRIEDVRVVLRVLKEMNARDKVRIAFGGNVSISNARKLLKKGLDILEIGREILDAPLLDLKFDVTDVR